MSAALDFTYQYAFPSGLQNKPKGKPTFSLATCNPEQASPYFFDGQVKSPRIMGDMLLTLSDVVRTHFFLPRPVLLDPVLTSNENLLRLEGFSGCCGVYARVITCLPKHLAVNIISAAKPVLTGFSDAENL